jgi:hypothetical protein
MTRLRVGIGLVLIAGAMCAGVAYAGDGKMATWRYDAHTRELPFSREERAESVWASGHCWKECGAYCAWGMAGCLKEDSQGRCLKLTDRCDRYCQRECRTMAGPFVPFELPWE